MESNCVVQALSSGSKISSKRVVTLGCFLLLSIAFISNLFFGFEIDSNIYDGVYYITLGGLGFTASEKFNLSKKEKSSKDDELITGV